MPTNPVLTQTFNPSKLMPSSFPDDSRMIAGAFAPSITLAKGTVVGRITASGLLKAYASGNSDGSQTPIGVLAYSIATDANSNVFYGDTAVASTINLPEATAAVYVAGTFKTAELVGWDAGAATALSAKTILPNEIRIP